MECQEHRTHDRLRPCQERSRARRAYFRRYTPEPGYTLEIDKRADEGSYHRSTLRHEIAASSRHSHRWYQRLP